MLVVEYVLQEERERGQRLIKTYREDIQQEGISESRREELQSWIDALEKDARFIAYALGESNDTDCRGSDIEKWLWDNHTRILNNQVRYMNRLAHGQLSKPVRAELTKLMESDRETLAFIERVVAPLRD